MNNRNNFEDDFTPRTNRKRAPRRETIKHEPPLYNRKEKQTKRLPSFGLAIILLTTSILSGFAGAFGVRYFDHASTTNIGGNGVTKENNLNTDSKATTVSRPKNYITKVSEEVGPAVVGISTTKSSWIESQNSESAGSGIVFDSKGYIVTNQHVVEGGTKVMVSLPGGKKVQAKVIGEDAKTDLAVLKVETTGLTAAKFGDSDAIRVGDSVIAIGNPLGEEFAGSVTSGILSAKDRDMSFNDDGNSRTYNVLQTDASINPGSSGGALLNESGEVVGINTLKISSAEGMGFAIPINEVKIVIKELMDTGYVKRAFLGVSTIYLDAETAKMYNTQSGMGVQQVVPGSAANKAGIVPGDIIVEIDGKKIESETDLTNAVNKKKVGETISLKIHDQNGKTRDVKIVLEENTNSKVRQ